MGGNHLRHQPTAMRYAAAASCLAVLIVGGIFYAVLAIANDPVADW